MRFQYPAAALCVAATMLPGCGGLQPLIGNHGATPLGRVITQPAAPSKSWMLPEAKGHALLYVSAADVYVYTYPKAKLVGTLTGFQAPAGMCPDNNGNIWIANFNGNTIVEYAHGGKQPIGSLTVPTMAHPQGCAIDAASGNLAVVGYPPASEPATVLVYTGATGTPTVYDIPLTTSSFCTYDNRGNLFVSGYVQWDSRFGVMELKRGSHKFKTVTSPSCPFGGYEPEPVQWDGRYVAIGTPASVVRYDIRNLTAVAKGETDFDDLHILNNAWIQDGKITVINRGGMGSVPAAQIDKYPAGGSPIRMIDYGSFGVTVSLARHR